MLDMESTLADMNDRPKRPRDSNLLAKRVVDIATGQRRNDSPPADAPLEQLLREAWERIRSTSEQEER